MLALTAAGHSLLPVTGRKGAGRFQGVRRWWVQWNTVSSIHLNTMPTSVYTPAPGAGEMETSIWTCKINCLQPCHSRHRSRTARTGDCHLLVGVSQLLGPQLTMPIW